MENKDFQFLQKIKSKYFYSEEHSVTVFSEYPMLT